MSAQPLQENVNHPFNYLFVAVWQAIAENYAGEGVLSDHSRVSTRRQGRIHFPERTLPDPSLDVFTDQSKELARHSLVEQLLHLVVLKVAEQQQPDKAGIL